MDIETHAIPMESLAELIQLQLDNGGRAKLTVTGCSMLPMLRNRLDVVELIPVSGKQKKGDVILYHRDNGQYVLHRIIAVDEQGYICCGDNQFMREPIKQDQLIAVVDSFTRKGRYYSVSAFGYRIYTAVWVGLFPLRRCYLAVRRPLGRLYAKVRKRLL